MTDTPAVVLLCLVAVLKCVFSLPVTSIFMLSPMTASSYIHTSRQWGEVVRCLSILMYESQMDKSHATLFRACTYTCKYRHKQCCEIPWPKSGRGCLVLCIEPQRWPAASFQSAPARKKTPQFRTTSRTVWKNSFKNEIKISLTFLEIMYSWYMIILCFYSGIQFIAINMIFKLQ